MASITALPIGWIEFMDKQSGDYYYYHAESKTTTWDRPAITDDTQKPSTTAPLRNNLLGEIRKGTSLKKVGNSSNKTNHQQRTIGNLFKPDSSHSPSKSYNHKDPASISTSSSKTQPSYINNGAISVASAAAGGGAVGSPVKQGSNPVSSILARMMTNGTTNTSTSAATTKTTTASTGSTTSSSSISSTHSRTPPSSLKFVSSPSVQQQQQTVKEPTTTIPPSPPNQMSVISLATSGGGGFGGKVGGPFNGLSSSRPGPSSSPAGLNDGGIGHQQSRPNNPNPMEALNGSGGCDCNCSFCHQRLAAIEAKLDKLSQHFGLQC